MEYVLKPSLDCIWQCKYSVNAWHFIPSTHVNDSYVLIFHEDSIA